MDYDHVWFIHFRGTAFYGRPSDLSTPVREHLETDRASHIFKHLKSSSAFRSACSHDNFAIIIQIFLQILWDNPTLNAQVKHVNLKICLIFWITIVIVLIIAIIIAISLVFIFHWKLLFISP